MMLSKDGAPRLRCLEQDPLREPERAQDEVHTRREVVAAHARRCPASLASLPYETVAKVTAKRLLGSVKVRVGRKPESVRREAMAGGVNL